MVHEEVPIDIYWTAEILQPTFENKFPALVYVLADSDDDGVGEIFHYNEAQLLSGFNFEWFMEAVKESMIKVDLSMHMKNDGRVRNHGIAFRVRRNRIPMCFHE